MPLTQYTDTRMNNSFRAHNFHLRLLLLPLLNENRQLFLDVLHQPICATVPLTVSLRTTPRLLVLQEITQALILSMTGLACKHMAIRHPIPFVVRGQSSPEILHDETDVVLGSATDACSRLDVVERGGSKSELFRAEEAWYGHTTVRVCVATQLVQVSERLLANRAHEMLVLEMLH